MTHTTHNHRDLVDELLDRYLSWREESAALDAAYRRWVSGPEDDRPLAFAAYRAQLDLEEQAAACYQRSLAAAAELDTIDPLSASELERNAAGTTR